MKLAIYPGSFDPLTNGHLDILKRALKIFDKVIILIAINPAKSSRFTTEEKKAMIKESIKDLSGVEVDCYQGLTVDYAKNVGATHLIRGLRAVSDFEYEFQLAAANAYANDKIDMVFFMAKGNTSFISSSAVMQLHDNGVDVSNLVPEPVFKYLK